MGKDLNEVLFWLKLRIKKIEKFAYQIQLTTIIPDMDFKTLRLRTRTC